jgi:hypothetical protein
MSGIFRPVNGEQKRLLRSKLLTLGFKEHFIADYGSANQ